MEGFVYFLKARESDLVKIGRTNKKAHLRRREIQNMSPVQLYSLGILRVPDYVQTERELHQLFDSWRTYGEWFDFSGGNIGTLKKCFKRKSVPFDYQGFVSFWRHQVENEPVDELKGRRPGRLVGRMRKYRKLAYG